MDDLIVGLGDRQYPIVIGASNLSALGQRVREALPKCDRLLVVTNPEVGRLHAGKVTRSLERAGLTVEVLGIQEGERHKTVATAEEIWDHLIRHGYTRQSALLALGGGVVGDITGFAAACYMRGIAFIQVPTTLLAMVDSSVGGKTGVNHPHAKNTIGAFWQPRLVFMDIALLGTLPVEEFRSGFAEVVKHGVIRDAAYFAYLEKNLDLIFGQNASALTHVVEGSCRIKAVVVERDEREAGLRAILNFGHTVGHAVEALSEYGTVRHGYAGSIGMAAAVGIAERMGLCHPGLHCRLTGLLEICGLPIRLPVLDEQKVMEHLRTDKKVRDGKVRFVLPVQMGEVVIRDDVSAEVIIETLRAMKEGKL
jgi:3-dehydroquinate synthase